MHTGCRSAPSGQPPGGQGHEHGLARVTVPTQEAQEGTNVPEEGARSLYRMLSSGVSLATMPVLAAWPFTG